MKLQHLLLTNTATAAHHALNGILATYLVGKYEYLKANYIPSLNNKCLLLISQVFQCCKNIALAFFSQKGPIIES